MSRALYLVVQWSWGLVQNLVGLVFYLRFRHLPRARFHGAIVTSWPLTSSVTLGLFIFLSNRPYAAALRAGYTPVQAREGLLVHEYGHTMQSLLLGPAYLLLIGLPSVLWAALPVAARRRRKHQISYFSFFTERSANYLGERVTGQSSLGQLIID